jgi:hypothetical protein
MASRETLEVLSAFNPSSSNSPTLPLLKSRKSSQAAVFFRGHESSQTMAKLYGGKKQCLKAGFGVGRLSELERAIVSWLRPD